MATKLLKLYTFIIFSLSTVSPFAATPINLRIHPNYFSNTLSPTPQKLSVSNHALDMQTVNQATDLNKTVHVRVKQMYAGYPVWGADAVLHIPHNQAVKSDNVMHMLASANKTRMNGTVYQDLQTDLQNAPQYIFNATQAQKALQTATQLFHEQTKQYLPLSNKQAQLIVYVDPQNKAHWAFNVEFNIQTNTIVTHPAYIMDAETFQVYRHWDKVETISSGISIQAGGYGGNVKTGKITYDGLPGDLSAISMERSYLYAFHHKCYYRNAQFFLSAPPTRWPELGFLCNTANTKHNNIYWDGDLTPQKAGYDTVNGGYSPANDALYNSKAVFDMYKTWYSLDAIKPTLYAGKPAPLEIVVHYFFEYWGTGENAAYDNDALFLGDGGNRFYPLTSPGVIAHEISHGFTAQHSNLIYNEESGGINESFSDMAAQAVNYYMYGKNDWMIGAEIAKENNDALRYMDQPSKDCYGEMPGNYCSIDNANQYYIGLEVHHSSGIFNRAFYFLATSPDWNTKKAFDVMVQANRFYWTPATTFQEAACGAIYAAHDLHDDLSAITAAFAKVGIDTTTCSTQTD